MTQWAFVGAAYAISAIGIVSLISWAFGSMRRAEAGLDDRPGE